MKCLKKGISERNRSIFEIKLGSLTSIYLHPLNKRSKILIIPPPPRPRREVGLKYASISHFKGSNFDYLLRDE